MSMLTSAQPTSRVHMSTNVLDVEVRPSWPMITLVRKLALGYSSNGLDEQKKREDDGAADQERLYNC